MRILIAPDKFKGSLSAQEVGEIVANGIREYSGSGETEIVPLADGGEGTADVLCRALGGTWRFCRVHDPLGRSIEAKYGWVAVHRLAVMEMSEAAGMWRLRSDEPQPDKASTFGVGAMLLDAVQQGAREIIIGLGGSATNDGGFGLARALGFRFFAGNRELSGAVTELATLERIVAPSKPLQPSQVKIVAATDVANPLLGEDGATQIFGPQKGVTPAGIAQFEKALSRLADVAREQFGADRSTEPGAGAAGGLGFGLTTFGGAVLRSGFEIVADAIQLPAKIAAADLIITGEGSLDRQTLRGKTAAGVVRLARGAGKPVWAVVGRADEDEEVTQLFDKVFVAKQPGMLSRDAMTQAPRLLRDAARRLGKAIRSSE